jgi:hypothetical protein
MQFTVPAHLRDVVPVEEPVDLLAAEHQQFFAGLRPAELLLGEAFVVKDEAVVLPQQALDLVAPAVGEGIERAAERVVPELLFRKRR